MGINVHKKYFKKRLFSFKRFFYLVMFLLLNFNSNSQDIIDYKNSFKSKRSFYFTWDSKATIISNEYAQIKSLKLGFDFGGKTKFGIGYSWHKGNIIRKFDFLSPSFDGKLKFRYASIFTEYVYFLDKHWEATIPAQLGLGIMQYDYVDTKDKILNSGGVFMLYEASSTLTYRVLRYFGLGLGIGFRLVLLTGNNTFKENLQSPTLSLRTKIYFDRVVEDFKKHFN